MASEDRFNALCRQLTEQLRYEHERQISELVAEISELNSRLRNYEQSPPQERHEPLAHDAPPETPKESPRSLPPSPAKRQKPGGLKTQQSRGLTVAAAAPAEPAGSSCCLLALVEKVVGSNAFEIFFSVLITLNGVLLACEAQHDSISVASYLEYKDVNTSYDEWDGAPNIFDTLGWVFGILFLVEVVLRIVAFRSRFPYEIWNWLDSIIVTVWIIGEVGPGLLPINPGLIRLTRFTRLVRLLKLVRKIGGFDSLFLMMTSLSHSAVILAWSGCLLGLLMMFNALLMNGCLAEFYFRNEGFPKSERVEVFRYFGSFTTSLFSMFELTLANWPPISRLLYESVTGWFIVIALAHKLAIGVAVIGVINGVFMQETFKVAQQDDEIMMRRALQASRTHADKMRRLMETADQSGEGQLDLEEFRRMFEDPGIKAWLASMELNPGDVDALFQMMDDGDGTLTVDEVIKGVAKFKGVARNLDLHMMLREQRQLKRHVETHLPVELSV